MEKFYLLLVLLLFTLFPTGGLLRLNIAPNIHFLPQDLIVGVLFAITSAKFVLQKISPVDKEFFLLSLVFVAIGFVSLAISCFLNPSYNFFVSALYALRYIAYLSIFFYPSFIKREKLVNSLLLYSGSAIVLIGFLQFFFYNNLGNLAYLGWDDHLYRLFSTFLDPNFVGVFYVIFLGFLANRIGKLSNIWKRKYESIMLCLAFISIYLTYSRSAFLALVILLISILIVLNKKVKLIIPLIVLSIFLLFLFSDSRVEGLNPFRSVSTSARIQSGKEALYIIKRNPIFGVGFSSYRYAQVKYNFRSEKGALVSNADAGTDNSFLFVLATTGVIGFLFYIFGYYYLLKDLFAENKVYFSTMVAVFVGTLFINVLFYIPILTFLFMMLAYRKR